MQLKTFDFISLKAQFLSDLNTSLPNGSIFKSSLNLNLLLITMVARLCILGKRKKGRELISHLSLLSGGDADCPDFRIEKPLFEG